MSRLKNSSLDTSMASKVDGKHCHAVLIVIFLGIVIDSITKTSKSNILNPSVVVFRRIIDMK